MKPVAVIKGSIVPPKKPKVVNADLRAYITRSAAARSLGYTKSGIRKYEESWFRECRIVVNDVVYYPRSAVEELRAALADDSAARCFELFGQGLGPSEVVMALKHRRPSLVRQYHREYLELRALEANVFLLELEPGMSASAWKRAHGLADGPIEPQFIRHALQVLYHRPELWREALSATAIWNERMGKKRKKACTRSADDRAEAALEG